MSEIIERAAKAMYELDPIMEQATDLDNQPISKPFAITWEQLSEIDDGYYEHYKERARVAIECIREPPSTQFALLLRMLNMNVSKDHLNAAIDWYHRMIDEVLK